LGRACGQKLGRHLDLHSLKDIKGLVWWGACTADSCRGPVKRNSQDCHVWSLSLPKCDGLLAVIPEHNGNSNNQYGGSKVSIYSPRAVLRPRLASLSLSTVHESVSNLRPLASRCPSTSVGCGSLSRFSGSRPVASFSYGPPRVELAHAMQALRQAARLMKCARIAERLASLAGVRRLGQYLQ
jgi:hypothetical protein